MTPSLTQADTNFYRLDKSAWEKHDLEALGLSFDDVPDLDTRITSAISEGFTSLKVSANAGVTLLTIPKGLTLEKLKTLARLDDRSFFIDEGIPGFSDAPVPRTYSVLVTNAVLSGSKRLSEEQQERALARTGYDRARTIEIAALCILNYMDSSEGSEPTRLYSRGKYARCAEETRVGFAPEGFVVSEDWQNFGGIAVARRFDHVYS